MSWPARWVGLATASALLGGPASALALEAGALGDEPVNVDVTEVTSLSYNFDNRDTRPNRIGTIANDDWGFWYNRLNLQATWGSFRLGLRLDNAWFFRSPNATQLALDMVALRPHPLPPGATPDPEYFRRKLDEAGVELSNRYQNWAYPAKWYFAWQGRDLEVDVGDFYAQFGRGLVLSVRKLDELSSDTTVRGVRLGAKTQAGPLRLRLTALGGSMNPLRLDDASGRWLGVSDDVLPSWVRLTEAGMPRALPTDFVQDTGDCQTFATCTYAPDRLAAAQVELASRSVKLGTQGSLLIRQAPLSHDAIRSSNTLFTGSQSVELPRLGEAGSLYAELAFQDMRRDGEHTLAQGAGTSLGYAAYLSGSLALAPVTLSAEARHYRRFFPLSANVALGRASEFSLVQYSAPPTTEALWVDSTFNHYNTCVTGGRLRADVEVAAQRSVFAWVGRSHTWAESVSNEACETTAAQENRIWDVASGVELSSERGRSRVTVTTGVRLDETAELELRVPGGTTQTYYRETYLRYDAIRSLGGPWSLQLQGWHRRRMETELTHTPWVEGQHLTGFEWAPHLSAALGVEYSTAPGVPTTYFNGQLGWRFTSDTSVGLFVGQRRGALRCVAGVCRVFPAFEGARLDATVRF